MYKTQSMALRCGQILSNKKASLEQNALQAGTRASNHENLLHFYFHIEPCSSVQHVQACSLDLPKIVVGKVGNNQTEAEM